MEDTHLSWRKSSYSDNGGADCVEVADRDNTIMIRDTQAREHGHLDVRPEHWRAFVAGIKTAKLPQELDARVTRTTGAGPTLRVMARPYLLSRDPRGLLQLWWGIQHR